jgi:hypothetical protein
MEFNNAPTLTMSKNDYDMLGRLLLETLALSGVCLDMKHNREPDQALLTPWPLIDEESHVIYRTAARELVMVFCRMVSLNHADTGDIDTPPWRQFFNLMKTQPMSCEPDVIFSALTSGKLPEA